MSEYTLANKFERYRSGIALVGCGGTGGFVAEGLCRLLLSYPGHRLILIDGDRVEERNLGRQSFYPEDLGRFKSQALAERLARRFGTPIAYSVSPLGDPRQFAHGAGPIEDCALIVGCVDNPLARAAIANRVAPWQWWLDAGNGAEHGQLLVGNSPVEKMRRTPAFYPDKGVVELLPLPSVVRPELLVPPPRPAGSCAEAGAAGEQGPTINQFMAALVVEMVRRLLERRLGWWQLFLDLESGGLRTVSPTPEAISRLTGIPVKKLKDR
jgi:PRTRC genetic system ThiF family protein